MFDQEQLSDEKSTAVHTEDCRRPEKVSILAAAADACRKGLGVAGAAGPEPPPAPRRRGCRPGLPLLRRQASLVLSAIFGGSVPMLRGCFRNAPCSPWDRLHFSREELGHGLSGMGHQLAGFLGSILVFSLDWARSPRSFVTLIGLCVSGTVCAV